MGEGIGRIADPATPQAAARENPKAFPNAGWFAGDNANLAIGQGEIAITPLQLANAYATFANGGTLSSPRSGPEVLDADGRQGARRAASGRAPPRAPARDPRPHPGRAQRAWSPPEGPLTAPSTAFPSTSSRWPARPARPRWRQAGHRRSSRSSAPPTSPQYEVTVLLEEAGFGAEPPRPWPAGSSRRWPASAQPHRPRAGGSGLMRAPVLGPRRARWARTCARRATRPPPGATSTSCSCSLGACLGGSGCCSCTAPRRAQGERRRTSTPPAILKRQALWVALGVVVMVVAAVVDYRVLRDLAPVLVRRHRPRAARRALAARHQLAGRAGVVPARVRSSCSPRSTPSSSSSSAWPRTAPPTGATSTCAASSPCSSWPACRSALIYRQPDLGTDLVFLAILMAMLLVAGARPRHIAVLTLLGVVGVVAVFQLGVLKQYQVDRLSALPRSRRRRAALDLQPQPVGDRHRSGGVSRARAA